MKNCARILAILVWAAFFTYFILFYLYLWTLHRAHSNIYIKYIFVFVRCDSSCLIYHLKFQWVRGSGYGVGNAYYARQHQSVTDTTATPLNTYNFVHAVKIYELSHCRNGVLFSIVVKNRFFSETINKIKQQNITRMIFVINNRF